MTTQIARTYKMKDENLKKDILETDPILHSCTGFDANGKGVIKAPVDFIHLSKNKGIPYAERNVVTVKGNAYGYQLFPNSPGKGKPNGSYGYYWYNTPEGKQKAKKSFFVCDTKAGRNVYLRDGLTNLTKPSSTAAAQK